MLRKGGCLPQSEVAELVNAWWQYSSETHYIGSRPSVSLPQDAEGKGCFLWKVSERASE